MPVTQEDMDRSTLEHHTAPRARGSRPRELRSHNSGATAVEASLVTVLFVMFLFFTIDAGRYFYTYAVFLWGAHEAVDLATKLPMELNTTAPACETPQAGQTQSDCTRYRNAVLQVIQTAEKRARMVGSTSPDAFVKLKTFDLYTTEEYASELSGLTPITGSVVRFNRPGELVRRNDGHSISTAVHPTRSFGPDVGEGWPKASENWNTIFVDHPLEVVIEAEMKPITPFIPTLTITARQQGFRRTGDRARSVPKDVDLCPGDNTVMTPGQCGCGEPTPNADGDSLADCRDGCDNDRNKITPGLCGCGVPDDGDNDGVPDCSPNPPNQPCLMHSDTDGIPDCNDPCPLDVGGDPTDTDGDGNRCNDKCIGTPRSDPGLCGCWTPISWDVDSDGDGVPFCTDGCPNHANRTSAGACGCALPDVSTDTDGDGIPDCVDGCPAVAGRDPGDTDSDGHRCDDLCLGTPRWEPGLCGCWAPVAWDVDADGDGVPFCTDGCPNHANRTNPGACGCALPDDPTDTDGDGIPDCVDGCPAVSGRDPGDTDSDGHRCDDLCLGSPRWEPGLCGCWAPISWDVDADGDGVPFCTDGCPNHANRTSAGACGCDRPDDATDTDRDGIPDCNDGCPTIVGGDAGDTDSDGHRCDDLCLGSPRWDPGLCGCWAPISWDEDTDRDGTPFCQDGCPQDPNKITPGRCLCGVVEDTGDDDRDGRINCEDTNSNVDCTACMAQESSCNQNKTNCNKQCDDAFPQPGPERDACRSICSIRFRDCNLYCCAVPECAGAHCISGGG